MKVTAIIESHYPERIPNVEFMVDSLIENGIPKEEIIILVDHTVPFETKARVMRSDYPMKINWWHGVASVLDTDYVVLLCDDLMLKKDSIQTLKEYASKYGGIDVFGFEGGRLADAPFPYTGSKSHKSSELESADYVIRFYFAKPKAFANALKLFHKLPRSEGIHDDLILSLPNRCAIVPVSKTVGWEELSEHEVGYSKRATHYQERDSLCNWVLETLK